MLHRIVIVVQALTVVSVGVFVVMLFANSPTPSPPASAEAIGASGGTDGAAAYNNSCSGCHGGDGSGGIAPPLANRVAERYTEAEQISLVTDGAGGMPAFGSRLDTETIAAVVAYTRTDLGNTG